MPSGDATVSFESARRVTFASRAKWHKMLCFPQLLYLKPRYLLSSSAMVRARAPLVHRGSPAHAGHPTPAGGLLSPLPPSFP